MRHAGVIADAIKIEASGRTRCNTPAIHSKAADIVSPDPVSLCFHGTWRVGGEIDSTAKHVRLRRSIVTYRNPRVAGTVVPIHIDESVSRHLLVLANQIDSTVSESLNQVPAHHHSPWPHVRIGISKHDTHMRKRVGGRRFPIDAGVI